MRAALIVNDDMKMILKTKKEIEKIKAEAEEMLSLYVPFGIVPKGPKELHDICITCLCLMERVGHGAQISLFDKK
jgi:hypothetical protein